MKTEMNPKREPKGELTICTLAMPGDTNPNGDIFGGWVVATMDLAGLVFIKQHTKHRIVTVAIHSMEFLAPVTIGDTISCYAEIVKIGRTSITIHMETWAKGYAEGANKNTIVTEGTFVYVAIDDEGKPTPLKNE